MCRTTALYESWPAAGEPPTLPDDESAIESASLKTVEEESRVNRHVQTQVSTGEFEPAVQKSQKTLVIVVENCSHTNESEENSNGTGLRRTGGKGMERKPIEGLGTIRTASDLERKKLEIELKASEEIAKIKQSLIEKRLELELASLQEDYNPNVRSLQHPSQNEMENFENSTENNTNLKEVEQLSLGYKNLQQQPPAPPPSVQVIRPFEPFLSPPILPSNPPEKRHFRPRPLENLQRKVKIPEKGRFMQPIEKPKYPAPTPMGSNPFKPQTPASKYLAVPQIPVAETYYSNMVADANPNLQQAPEEPGCSTRTTGVNRALSIWRTMMSRVRKKLKRKPPAW